MKRALVCGAGGFIGNHLVTHLKKNNYYVVGVDLKLPLYNNTDADEFIVADLTKKQSVDTILARKFDQIYQLAADMGGAGYVFTEENDANIMHNSTTVNLNVCKSMVEHGIKNVFFSSSACVYPEHIQTDSATVDLKEDDAYPANPDSNYGWEKLFSERLYSAFAKNYGLNVRIARLHNVFGPMGSYNNGKEKAPAALCRKIALSEGRVDVWGNGNQSRSFLYIDECLQGIDRIVNSNYNKPINLGSELQITINELAQKIAAIANKQIQINNIPGPTGVNARTSNNNLLRQVCGWAPMENLELGLEKTYNWIYKQLEESNFE